MRSAAPRIGVKLCTVGWGLNTEVPQLAHTMTGKVAREADPDENFGLGSPHANNSIRAAWNPDQITKKREVNMVLTIAIDQKTSHEQAVRTATPASQSFTMTLRKGEILNALSDTAQSLACRKGDTCNQ